jgi:hypothetical protein
MEILSERMKQKFMRIAAAAKADAAGQSLQ